MILNILKNRNVILCGLLPNFTPEEITLEQYKKAKGLYIEDPWERLKSIFSTDQHGGLHPELKYAEDMCYLGIGVGIVYGGITAALGNVDNYVRSNESTLYKSNKDALRQMMDHGTITFVKGAIKWAPAFGAFFGTFSLVSSCCEAYRGRPHIMDSGIAGLVVGGLSRFMYGFKGMISGGVVGGTLGSIYGVLLWGLNKITKTEQVELKHAHFAFLNYRKQLIDHARTKKPEEYIMVEKSGLHDIHVNDPLEELDNEKQAVKNSQKPDK